MSTTGTASVTVNETIVINVTLQTQQPSDGGIPGFPLEAAAFGILLCVIWLRIKNRDQDGQKHLHHSLIPQSSVRAGLSRNSSTRITLC
ncbi:MAG: hypothetical protein NTY03_01555 [Candidatus Bathyarchaeota archaeon]|nr:hypothetical protein [Candidatus Bathyarchaeota archaeon]